MKITKQELVKIIQEQAEKIAKNKHLFEEKLAIEAKLKEMFDDEDDFEDVPMSFRDFDANEFKGDAKNAAMSDIEADGMKFDDLGANKFEKQLNVNDFIDDLQRQNMDLPNDKGEVNKIKAMMDKRTAHEKKFGVGSLNEKVTLKQLREAIRQEILKLKQDADYWVSLDLGAKSLNDFQVVKGMIDELVAERNVENLPVMLSIFSQSKDTYESGMERLEKLLGSDVYEVVQIAYNPANASHTKEFTVNVQLERTDINTLTDF